MIRHHHAGWILSLSMAVLAPGCSSGDGLPREPISGTVTLDGEPLSEGAIQFSPAGTAPSGVAVSAGAVIAGGRFSIASEHGLVPGTYKVGVNAADRGSAQTGPAGPGGKSIVRPKELIPNKYNAQTTLIAEVKKGGPNDFRFELQSK
jgi:hypothetical protein